MKRRILLATAMFISTTVFAQSFDEWKIIHAGILLADAREEAKTEQSIVIRNNVIVEIREGYVSPGQVSGAANA